MIRNYGGVQGLVVAPRFLSEAAERRLFESMGTRCPLPDGRVETKYGRCDLSGAPRARYDRFSPDLWRVINGIRDHVFPELLLPDFALFWSYALKRNRGGGVAFNGEAFARHYDSKITYGETVAGLSVGRASLLVMERCPCDKVERQCKCFFRNSGVATERRRGAPAARERLRDERRRARPARPLARLEALDRLAESPGGGAGLEHVRRAALRDAPGDEALERVLPREPRRRGPRAESGRRRRAPPPAAVAPD